MTPLQPAACRQVDTPIGPMLLAATDDALAGAWFDGQSHHPGGFDAVPRPGPGGHAVLDAATRQLADWFAGERSSFDLPLDPWGGTPFQRGVWLALRSIPHGETRCYADIARACGRPAAVRAVGAAIGRNPLSIVVPCHRVVGSDGALTGYAGGLDRKRALLALERSARPFVLTAVPDVAAGAPVPSPSSGGSSAPGGARPSSS